MTDNRRFQRGSGVYICSVCGKKTRATGKHSNEYVSLCASCYDEAGLENEHQDGLHNNNPKINCPICYPLSIERLKEVGK